MSSLRNSVKRRAHKERAQPSERKKYGLLEKHKDYVLRAKDFHSKEQRLQALREKAAFRNPDEFYYKMINSRVKNGIHRSIDSKKYTQEELLLMKTQDIKYVLNKTQAEKKKIERLQATLHSIDQPRSNDHIYFADNSEEAREIQPGLTAPNNGALHNNLPRRIRKARGAAYKELEERTQRHEKLRSMVMAMCLQKELMGKGRKRKLRDEEKAEPTEAPVYKWRKERKK